MVTAQGAMRAMPFQHKPKVRRCASEDQKLKLSAWHEISSVKRTQVDIERINYRGTIYTQGRVFDARPRIRRWYGK